MDDAIEFSVTQQFCTQTPAETRQRTAASTAAGSTWSEGEEAMQKHTMMMNDTLRDMEQFCYEHSSTYTGLTFFQLVLLIFRSKRHTPKYEQLHTLIESKQLIFSSKMYLIAIIYTFIQNRRLEPTKCNG